MHCSIKNLTGFCSTDSQELPVTLSAGAIVVGAGPRITSSCHCSSLVSSNWARIWLLTPDLTKVGEPNRQVQTQGCHEA